MSEVIEGIYMITADHIDQIAEKLYEKILEARKNPSNFGETCNKNEAAQILGVTRCTVYNMVKDGRIKTTADGKRIVTSSVVSYMEKNPESFKSGRRGRKKYV